MKRESRDFYRNRNAAIVADRGAETSYAKLSMKYGLTDARLRQIVDQAHGKITRVDVGSQNLSRDEWMSRFDMARRLIDAGESILTAAKRVGISSVVFRGYPSSHGTADPERNKKKQFVIRDYRLGDGYPADLAERYGLPLQWVRQTLTKAGFRVPKGKTHQPGLDHASHVEITAQIGSEKQSLEGRFESLNEFFKAQPEAKNADNQSV